MFVWVVSGCGENKTFLSLFYVQTSKKNSIIHQSFTAPEANGNECAVAHTLHTLFTLLYCTICTYTNSTYTLECMRKNGTKRNRMRHRISSIGVIYYSLRTNICADWIALINEMESSSVCCNRFACDVRLSFSYKMHSPPTYSLYYRQFPFIEFKFGRRDSCTHTINASIDLLSILNIFVFCSRLLSHPFIAWHFAKWTNEVKWSEFWTRTRASHWPLVVVACAFQYYLISTHNRFGWAILCSAVAIFEFYIIQMAIQLEFCNENKLHASVYSIAH